MKAFPVLFARATNKKIKQWSVTSEDDGTYTTSAGYKGGIMTPHTTYCDAKNVGKKSETTIKEQAEKEAAAKWEKQHKKGYRESIEEADAAPKRPNLCLDYKDRGHNMDYPALTGPKLNGMRCLAIRNQNTVVFKGYSRELNPVEIPEHVQAELQLMGMIPDIIDGELYVHGMHLQDIISLVKRPREKDGTLRPDVLKLQFRLFELPHNTMIAELRLSKLAAIGKYCMEAMSPSAVAFVPSFLCNNEAEMFEYREKFVADGYEGSVTRACNGTYDWGAKTKTMMKSKPFQDAEFLIVAIEADKDGLAVAVCVTKKVQAFKASFEGKAHFNTNTEYRAHIMANPEQYINKQATIRFQDYSKDGIPTIGNTIQAIRDYE